MFAGIVRDISERVRTEETMQEQIRLSQLEVEIGHAVAEGGKMPAMLQQCVTALVRHLNAAFARVWLLNEAENVLELVASAGIYTHLNGGHARVPVGKFKIGLIALLLWLVLATYAEVVMIAFLGSFMATILIFSMAFFVRGTE